METGVSAYTEDVVNLGAMQLQTCEHVPFTLEDFEFLPGPLQEANTGLPLNSFSGQFSPRTPINFIRIPASARGNAVYVRPNSGPMRFQLLNGIYYPLAPYYNNGNLAMVEIPLPLKRNWSFAVTIFAPGLTSGYQDACVIGYGYNASFTSRYGNE